jgi:fatty acid desaturase
MREDLLAMTMAEQELDLDGSTGVHLAPVQGMDNRHSLPKSMFTKHPAIFSTKFAVAMCIIAAVWAAVAIDPAWWVILLAVPVAGLMYAHLVELQHECLHEHAYRRRSLNRLVGFLCGVPMLSAYWHYKYDHLRHHAFLGTPQNREFFNYRFSGLGTVPGFLRGCYHLGRYADVGRNLNRSVIGRTNPQVTKSSAARKIRTEYQILAMLLIGACAASVVSGTLFLIWVWVLPLLLVAEPAHFLIELPEHFGLNTQTNPDVLSNTRTVNAGKLARWYTNSNDIHTAHHYHQGVPMANVRALHGLIEGKIATVEDSYWSFYRDVIIGRITYQDMSETCMNR